MSDPNEPVIVSREGSLAIMTLNRPDRLNAFDVPRIHTMWNCMAALGRDSDVRVVVLTGAGRAFCAGGDLAAMMKDEPVRPGDRFLELAAVFHQFVLEIRTMPKPVIAAINGPAAGGGFSIALACDLRLISESAYLQQAYTTSGLCIDGGGTFSLPRLVGLARALEISMLDERIEASRALELGLVTRVLPDEDLLPEAKALAGRLAKKAVGNLGRVKRLFNMSHGSSLERQLERERQGLADSANSPEGREGVRAFLEKRRPVFGPGEPS
jgi:2-(1,2-epoxy-1,2-dihydrophenyl)acetyl-CoA isomerase